MNGTPFNVSFLPNRFRLLLDLAEDGLGERSRRPQYRAAHRTELRRAKHGVPEVVVVDDPGMASLAR